jgi:hypothetical protein
MQLWRRGLSFLAEHARVASRKRNARARRRRLGRLWAVVLAGVVAFLYYQPITTWLETRAELGRRQAEVVGLRAERARLEARFEQETSLPALARDARCIGYVRPGERLFIVGGIPEARRQCGATLGDDG